MKRSIWIESSNDDGCHNQTCGGQDGGGCSSRPDVTKSSMGARTFTGAETANPDLDIAQEFHQLSLEERNLIYEDLHGAAKPIVETPQLVQQSLKQMQLHLENYKGTTIDRSSYDLALSRHRAYVENPKFRLAFLRCDRFQAKEAAVRYLSYFSFVHHLFGERCLGHDISIHDLSPRERKELKHGHLQFLNQRDAAGRAIQFLDPLKLMSMFAAEESEEDMHTRTCFYLTMHNILNSVETQRNGIVAIVYGVDTRVKQHSEFKIPRARFLKSLSRCYESMPMRTTSFHFLSNDIRLKYFMYLFQFALTRAIRCRFQLHVGTAVECEYALMTYGIPMASMPTNDNGEIIHTKHLKLLAKLKQKDDALKKATGVVDWNKAIFLPTRKDVLFGRGKPYQDHAGTLRMRALIAHYWDDYNTIKGRGGKLEVAQRIVNEIHQGGGRFLQLDTQIDWWLPVPDKEAAEKICQGFRKKRETKLIEAGAAQVQKQLSNKRTRALVPEEESKQDTSKVDAFSNSLDDNELAYLLDGTALETTAEPVLLPEHQPLATDDVQPMSDALDDKELAYLLETPQGEEPGLPLVESSTSQHDPKTAASEDLEPISYRPQEKQQAADTRLFSVDVAKALLSVLGNNTSGGETKIDETDPSLHF